MLVEDSRLMSLEISVILKTIMIRKDMEARRWTTRTDFPFYQSLTLVQVKFVSKTYRLLFNISYCIFVIKH